MREYRYRHESGQLPPSLEKVPLLSGLEDSMIDTLLSDAVLLECNPGETIISEGDDSKFFCILLKGAVDITKNGEKIARFAQAGEIVGELALATENARTASVTASTEVFCLKVEPNALGGLSEAERNGFFAKLYQFVVKILGDRLEESTRQITRLEEKVATLSGRAIENSDASEDGPNVYRI